MKINKPNMSDNFNNMNSKINTKKKLKRCRRSKERTIAPVAIRRSNMYKFDINYYESEDDDHPNHNSSNDEDFDINQDINMISKSIILKSNKSTKSSSSTLLKNVVSSTSHAIKSNKHQWVFDLKKYDINTSKLLF